MHAQITDEHRWLHRFTGTWSFEMGGAEPGASPPHTGTQTVHRLGDAWTLFDDRSPIPASEGGGEMMMQMALGYDPAKGHFIGTFIVSMMNHLWVYHGGKLDADRRTLTLEAEGPAFDGTPGTVSSYRDEIEIVNADERLLRGNVQDADGNWTCFMTARYRRVC